MAGRGPARPGSARHGLAGPGRAGHGGARQGPAGLGTAGQGKGADGPFLKIERNESNSMTDNCTTPTPRCPKCGRPTATTSGNNDHVFYSHHCKLEFEDCDDGETGYGRPDRIAERNENLQRKPFWAKRRY